jgi:uncharacterized tellurite resistance protein B-like protein
VNSPRAKARLVVLALLADGRLDEREMAALERRGVFADLGIAREDFVQVLYDFCGDVAGQLPVGAGTYQLTPQMLAGLFGEVADRTARNKLLQHIVAVISSDGRLSDAEASLFESAIDHWKPHAGNLSRKEFPELHYG